MTLQLQISFCHSARPSFYQQEIEELLPSLQPACYPVHVLLYHDFHFLHLLPHCKTPNQNQGLIADVFSAEAVEQMQFDVQNHSWMAQGLLNLWVAEQHCLPVFQNCAWHRNLKPRIAWLNILIGIINRSQDLLNRYLCNHIPGYIPLICIRCCNYGVHEY